MKLTSENLFRATSLDELVERVQESTSLLPGEVDSRTVWWRGQADLKWVLAPRLFRDGFADCERDMVRRFVSNAPTRNRSVPNDIDYVSWLTLMQHYRLPTRLLDWTESVLIAAYFAVRKYRDMPGAVWGLFPSELNRNQGDRDGEVLRMSQVRRPQEGQFDVYNNPAIYVIRAPFEPVQRGGHSEKIFAIPTNHFDVRQMVQQSTFTIQGTEQGLDELDGCKQFLVRIEIPSDAKSRLKDALAALGINDAYLFPDLENLAKTIANRYTRR